MPFTFAHPVIVLPFNYIQKHWFSMTGLVMGSMVPDFEYFLRLRIKSIYSHTWTGLFWFDVPLGLLLTLLYSSVIKNRLIDHLPRGLNNRFQQFKNVSLNNSSFYFIVVICISVLIGAISHLVWDGFTHPNGYFVNVIPCLSAILKFDGHYVYVYKIIQHASTVIGLSIIILTVLFLPTINKVNNHSVANYWFKVILTGFIVLIIRVLSGLSFREYGSVLVSMIAGCFLGLIIASIPTERANS